MEDAADLDLVCAAFGELGLTAVRIPAVRGGGKTPDFQLFDAHGQLVAHCEVKSPRDTWLTELWKSALPGQNTVGGARPDPVFNRIGRNLLKAAAQLNEYGPAKGIPTIVVLVNHDTAAGFNDLIEVVTGKLLLRGRKYVKTTPVDPKWMVPALASIDAVGWINARRPTQPLWFHTGRSAELGARMVELLGPIAVRI